jgi:hypothetical protein
MALKATLIGPSSVERTHAPIRNFVARVDAENLLIANIRSLKDAGATVALITLAFLGNRSQNFRRMGFVKFVENNLIRDRLLKRLQDGGIDRSHYGSAFVAFERDDLFPVLFWHNAAAAVDASASMRDDREMQRFGGHDFIVAPDLGWNGG